MRTLILIVFAINTLVIYAKENYAEGLFTTSKCFDLIASLQYFDKIKDAPQFSRLAADSVFMKHLNTINENVTASKLCNFYATFNGNRNDMDSCVLFFRDLNDNPLLESEKSGWIKNIVSLQQDLYPCLADLNTAGYSEYWESEIKPTLDKYIASYPVAEATLNEIHDAMTEISGPEGLSDTHSNIYVLNIDNAFNLADESFCCTPLLLDTEMEKRFRLDFLKVYTHENLHRLKVSDDLMKRLEELKADDFYKENEAIANNHREGLNEAFVVAAEVFISHNIGRRDAQSVYDEFKEYVDGSLVLAPIIYTHLDEKSNTESLNDFILRLFDNGTISVGSVKSEYEKAMQQIKATTEKQD
ncbi:MAG: hypothetical protein K2L34_07635 [Muribaculaceae bacterium]|nr:hypothetical protein [Muribaculaceae bacterium]